MPLAARREAVRALYGVSVRKPAKPLPRGTVFDEDRVTVTPLYVLEKHDTPSQPG